ncbi:MAG: hypothetical protein OXL36_21060 [Bryobacterales bacterium]|nr:hypothetical protein [Bryobacterales bacterium]MDE0296681.1 hypothetical protein [Bryobacterales bacterium]
MQASKRNEVITAFFRTPAVRRRESAVGCTQRRGVCYAPVLGEAAFGGDRDWVPDRRPARLACVIRPA